jgi:hypothetical protein
LQRETAGGDVDGAAAGAGSDGGNNIPAETQFARVVDRQGARDRKSVV